MIILAKCFFQSSGGQKIEPRCQWGCIAHEGRLMGSMLPPPFQIHFFFFSLTHLAASGLSFGMWDLHHVMWNLLLVALQQVES